MNNKLLSVVLVTGIAATGFAGISAANNSGSLLGNKSEMRQLFEKEQSGETLTADEQAQLESVKGKMGKMHGRSEFGKRAGLAHLTDEEKTALESMTDDEKKTFFDAKKVEMKTKMEAHKAVIDKLIAGETLTADEEATRLEILAHFEEENNEHPKRRDGGDIIAKLVAGDELTADEQAQLVEIQAKHAEREAQRAILEPIMEKLKAGETLTAEEQTTLDANKPPMMEQGKGHGSKGGRHGESRGYDNHDDM